MIPRITRDRVRRDRVEEIGHPDRGSVEALTLHCREEAIFTTVEPIDTR
ncbi:MAG: hypothetical protein GTN81_14565 [Proteobacteria bacterium]|nr:hypothetical protein [Pseudomonadota bacterium]